MYFVYCTCFISIKATIIQEEHKMQYVLTKMCWQIGRKLCNYFESTFCRYQYMRHITLIVDPLTYHANDFLFFIDHKCSILIVMDMFSPSSITIMFLYFVLIIGRGKSVVVLHHSLKDKTGI
jgi:hypothetical protein